MTLSYTGCMERIALLVKNLADNLWVSFLCNSNDLSFVAVDGEATRNLLCPGNVDRIISLVPPTSSPSVSLWYDRMTDADLMTVGFNVGEHPCFETDKASLQLALSYLLGKSGTGKIALLCHDKNRYLSLFKETVKEAGIEFDARLVTEDPEFKRLKPSACICSDVQLLHKVRLPIPCVCLQPVAGQEENEVRRTGIELVFRKNSEICPLLVAVDTFEKKDAVSYAAAYGMDFENLALEKAKLPVLPPSVSTPILHFACRLGKSSSDVCFREIAQSRIDDDKRATALVCFAQAVGKAARIEDVCMAIEAGKDGLGFACFYVVVPAGKGKLLWKADGSKSFGQELLLPFDLDEGGRYVILPLPAEGYVLVRPLVYRAWVLEAVLTCIAGFIERKILLSVDVGKRLLSVSSDIHKRIESIYAAKRRLGLKERTYLLEGLSAMEHLVQLGFSATGLRAWNPKLYDLSFEDTELPAVWTDKDLLSKVLLLAGAKQPVSGHWGKNGICISYAIKRLGPQIALLRCKDVMLLSGGAFSVEGNVVTLQFPFPSLDGLGIVQPDSGHTLVVRDLADRSLDACLHFSKTMEEFPDAPLAFLHLREPIGVPRILLKEKGKAFALVRGSVIPPSGWSSTLLVHAEDDLMQLISDYLPEILLVDHLTLPEISKIRQVVPEGWILLIKPTEVDQSLYEVSRLLLLSPILLENNHFLTHLESLLAGTCTTTVSSGLPVKRAVVYMEKNLSRPLARWQIAEAAVASEDYLSRCFKREFGLSPWDYLIAIRMQKGRDLLGKGHLTIRDVAEACGYRNQAYFSKVFKDYFGSAPKKFRT